MKLFSCFLVLTLFIAKVNSQEIRKLDTLFTYKPFTSFFERHSNVKELRFWPDLIYKRQVIEIIESDSTCPRDFNHFNLNDTGEQYFFEKRFGTFNLPSALYKDHIDNKADYTEISGIIRWDSVFLSIKSTYYNDNEIRFIKLEPDWGYKMGIHILAKELESSLVNIKIASTDSLVYVKALIGRDSSCAVWEITGCNDSVYKKALIAFFDHSGPWIPYKKDGFNTRAYQRLYLRLNPDKSYTIAPKYYW